MAKEMTLDNFVDFLQNKAENLKPNLEKTIKLCCQKVQSDIKYSMDHTSRDTSKSYFTNNKSTPHHPSLPDNPPAVDTGALKASINYEVETDGREVVGFVGSTLSAPEPYDVWMEYGTSDGRIAPRPWLRPAMHKNNEFIRKQIALAVKNTLSGGN